MAGEGREPSLEHSLAFLVSLQQGGYSPASPKMCALVLRLFHQWRGERLDFKVKLARRLAEYHPAAVIEKAISLAKEHSPRDYLVLLLMARAGLRREELANLMVGQVDLESGYLRFEGKGRKERAVPLHQELREALAGAVKGKAPEDSATGYSPKMVYLAVKRWGARAGYPRRTPMT